MNGDASNPTYNARGTLTALDYGNGVAMAITAFNSKLQATAFEVKKGATSIVKKDYQFYADGSLKFSKDLINDKFDRLYKYDNVGRTIESKSGVEARGGTDSNLYNIPYSHQYQHDAFGNMTQIAGRYYNSGNTTDYSFNNQNRNLDWTYDADGNTTEDADAGYKYDAAGRTVSTTEYEFATGATLDSFDGDGQLVKRVRNSGSTTPAPQVNYYIRSSVLNKVVSETDGTGKKMKTFVPANGTTLATQELLTSGGTTSEKLTFIHQDASGSSVQQTKAYGTLNYAAGGRTGEYDALGRNVANASQFITLTVPPESEGGVDLFGTSAGYRPGGQIYRIDGLVATQSEFSDAINSGGIGGVFGLIEQQARMSARPPRLESLQVGEMLYKPNLAGAELAIGEAIETGLPIIRNIVINSNWSVNLSIAPQSQQQQTGKWQVTQYSDEKTSFDKIDAILKDPIILSDECTKAFEAIGATSIKDQLLAGNVRFITQRVFMNPDNDSSWAPDKEFADGVRATANASIDRIYGVKANDIIRTSDVTQEGEYKGKRYIGVTDYGIKEKLDHFSITIIHSLIHSGGVPGKTTPGTHDLAYKGKKYDDVIEACQRKESRVKKSAGQGEGGQ